MALPSYVHSTAVTILVTVVLILSGPVHQDAKEHKAVMTPTVLSLVYAADAAHPDVFRLQKGAF